MILLKRFIFTVWSKGSYAFKVFFLETIILWKSNILKRFIFLVLEYGNLTGIKTHRDRLGNSRKAFLDRRFQFSDFGRDWRTRRGFRYFLVVDPSFFCLFYLWIFEIFSFSLWTALLSFHPKVTFFLFIHFLFFFLFNCPIMHSKIQNLSQMGEWFIKIILAEEKKQQPCWLRKIPQEKISSV